VEFVPLIWSSGLTSKVQFSFALVIAMARTLEELCGLPGPVYTRENQ
jgi:hypothetical protein